MFKRALKKLRGKAEEKKPSKPAAPVKPAPQKPSPKPQSAKILTAEGWKRLMMKKYRKP